MIKRFLLALTALVVGASLQAQEYSGGVKGTVVNRNGRQGIENARLVLMRDAQAVATVATDAEGNFLIGNLSDGM